MHAYAWIFLQPVYRRAADGPDWIRRLLLAALFLLGPSLSVLGLGWQVAWLAGVLIPCGMLGLLWWMQFMQCVLLQLTPTMVLTTPSLQRRLCRATVLMWAALSIVYGGLASILYGHFLLYVVGTGLALLASNSLTLQPRWGTGFGTIWLAIAYLRPQWLEIPAHMSVTMQLAVGLVLLLLTGAYQLAYLFPRDAARVRRPLRLIPIWGAAAATPARRFRGSALFDAALRRDCRRRHSGRLLLHAIGPEFHWAYWLWPACIVTLAALVGSFMAPKQMSWLLLYLLATVVGPHPIRAAIGKTRKEQALVWLAPLVPRHAAFKRLLGLQLLQWFIVRWLLASAAILLVLACHGVDARELWISLCRFSIFLLPAGAVLADFSRGEGPYGRAVDGIVQIVLVVAVGLYEFSGLPWSWFCVLCLLLAALHVVVRWRSMMAAPPAFLARN